MAQPAHKINFVFNSDPTRTLTLRSRFISDCNARWRMLKGAINNLLIEENFLNPIEYEGPPTPPRVIAFPGLVANYEYRRSSYKVNQFMGWLEEQEALGILEISAGPGILGAQPWTNTYIQSSYQSGMIKARNELRAAGVDIPNFAEVPRGISAVFNQPFHADRVALAFTRTFNEMKGIVGHTNAALGRELALGMAQGLNPREIARNINNRIDKIGMPRARLIARTEVVQVHNEASLNEFEAAEAIIGEEILVQWWSALDSRVRPSHDKHTGRHGKIYTKDEGRALLGEPNCRCTLIPYIPSIQDKPTLPEPKKKAKPKPKAKPKRPSKAQLKKERDEAVAAFQAELDKPYAERAEGWWDLRHQKMVAENRYAQTLTAPELTKAKADILMDMAERSTANINTAAMRRKFGEATEWIPYDLLNELKYNGYDFHVSKQTSSQLRAFFRSSEKLCKVARNDTYQVWAHELSHAVDDFLSNNRSTGLIWEDTLYGTKEEVKSLRLWFDKQHSGTKGKYKNGDGDFWRNNWLSDYEGRIYTGRAAGSRGQEWWAMNCQRYAEYRYRMGPGIKKQMTYLKNRVNQFEANVERLKKALREGKSAGGRILDEPARKMHRGWLSQNEADLDNARLRLKEFEDPDIQETWALRLSKWGKAKRVYPELTAFIENKFKGDFIASW